MGVTQQLIITLMKPKDIRFFICAGFNAACIALAAGI
jgi:hypothetical protein